MLLIGFIVVVAIVDLLITGRSPNGPSSRDLCAAPDEAWCRPEAVLAAYRVGDSINSITPLNAYFELVVGFAQKYDKNAGVGTVVALMLPCVAWLLVIWTLLFAAWYLLGLLWGL